MLIDIFIELVEYFYITVTRNLLPQGIFNTAVVEEMSKSGQRCRNYSSIYHTGADQKAHKMLELIFFSEKQQWENS